MVVPGVLLSFRRLASSLIERERVHLEAKESKWLLFPGLFEADRTEELHLLF
jgi:hypothetical protein